MSVLEALNWLERERRALPLRLSGEDGIRFLIKLTQPIAFSLDPTDRSDLLGALREWIKLRSEPQTMVALHIATAHVFIELKQDIEELLLDVKEGKAFLPYYEAPIRTMLDELVRKGKLELPPL